MSERPAELCPQRAAAVRERSGDFSGGIPERRRRSDDACASVTEQTVERDRSLTVVARRYVVWLFVCMGFISALRVNAQQQQPWEWFTQDIEELTSQGHRLSGTPEGRGAVGYVEGRLRSLGVSVYPLEMPVWQATSEPGGCELVVDGVSLPVTPMRPNIVALPATPAGGVTGPMVYGGRGDWASLSGKSLRDAVVVLEQDTADWQRCFALGARAVVFMGRKDDKPTVPAVQSWSGAPVPMVRVWVDADAQGKSRGVNLTQDRERVTLHSRVQWNSAAGRNLVAVIPGSAPPSDAMHREVLVVAVPLDSFGVVPEHSPAARSAANVAALLEAAQRWQRSPLPRTVVLLFVDQQARGHQGAREVYDALFMSQEEYEQLRASHDSEIARVDAVLSALKRSDWFAALDDRASQAALVDELRRQAERLRGDITQRLQEQRLTKRATQAVDPPASGSLEQQQAGWDEVRRALHQGTFSNWADAYHAQSQASESPSDNELLMRSLLTQLREATRRRLSQRRDELLLAQRVDQQRDRLRDALPLHEDAGDALKRIVVHAAMELSDGSTRWVVSAGEDTWQAGGDLGTSREADAPGYYGPTLQALAESASTLDLPMLINTSLRDPDSGRQLVAGPRFHSGAIAGMFGVYQVGLVTAYDVLPREGRPSDILALLDAPRVRSQANEVFALLGNAAGNPSLSQPPRFADKHQSNRVLWDAGQLTGPVAGLKLVGGLAEDRPADGAIVAVWPGVRWGVMENMWSRLTQGSTAAWEPVRLLRADAHGRFALTASHRDAEGQVIALAALPDLSGALRAITSQATLNHPLTSAIRTELLPLDAPPIVLPWEPHASLRPQQLKVLTAAGNAEPPAQRRLIGQADGYGFAYAPSRLWGAGIKVFQPRGPVLLDTTDEQPMGAGLEIMAMQQPQPLTPISAADLWQLNEQRLGILRTRGVSKPDLESLHGLSSRRLQAAQRNDAHGSSDAHGSFTQSLALSERLYQPLRAALDDLVNAVVVLLLLAIPFAFALERLSIGAVTIYGRITGFIVFFMGTFALLYALHPGFAIAATPVLVFLAFAILLLSSMVIWLLVRKFQTELAELQGRADAGAAADAQASQAAVLLAAVGMGISTMRRRPTRTILTAVTVMVLTFTILSFASFGSRLGVSVTTLGAVDPDMPAGTVLLRRLDYGPLAPGATAILTGLGTPIEQWWLTDERLTIASRTGDRGVEARGVIGLQPHELTHWPALARALDPRATPEQIAEQLEKGGVYLPGAMMDDLGLRRGDAVLLHGSLRTVAGRFDSAALTRLRHVDERAVLPVDFFDATNAQSINTAASAAADDTLLDAEVQRDYTRLSADQVAVASAAWVRAVGGELTLLTLDPPPGLEPAELADTLASITPTPVWSATPSGVQRRIFTTLPSVEGAGRVLVPLILGGLIIFGTLMGSITDRQREIYTFSALGLSPKHVGALFFAEAAVYAILGGMGGQLLAQLVASGAGVLSRAGYIEPLALNYSSTQALFAMLAVALVVLLSALYPARRAARSANPGIARSWTMPPPGVDAQSHDVLDVLFPFTVSTYDMTGVVAFLAEHFRGHQDAGLGSFAAQQINLGQDVEDHIHLRAQLALAPFDLGVTQHLTLTATPSQLPGVDEVRLHIVRRSGAKPDWVRANRTFLQHLRRQFLLWRTLRPEAVEHYRRITLESLGQRTTGHSARV